MKKSPKNGLVVAEKLSYLQAEEQRKVERMLHEVYTLAWVLHDLRCADVPV